MSIPICLDDSKWACGCDVCGPSCDCKPEPFRVTRAQLRGMNKRDLLALYTRCLSDEMSPIMWRGFAKADILEMFLDGAASVELTPF